MIWGWRNDHKQQQQKVTKSINKKQKYERKTNVETEKCEERKENNICSKSKEAETNETNNPNNKPRKETKQSTSLQSESIFYYQYRLPILQKCFHLHAFIQSSAIQSEEKGL